MTAPHKFQGCGLATGYAVFDENFKFFTDLFSQKYRDKLHSTDHFDRRALPWNKFVAHNYAMEFAYAGTYVCQLQSQMPAPRWEPCILQHTEWSQDATYGLKFDIRGGQQWPTKTTPLPCFVRTTAMAWTRPAILYFDGAFNRDLHLAFISSHNPELIAAHAVLSTKDTDNSVDRILSSLMTFTGPIEFWTDSTEVAPFSVAGLSIAVCPSALESPFPAKDGGHEASITERLEMVAFGRIARLPDYVR